MSNSDPSTENVIVRLRTEILKQLDNFFKLLKATEATEYNQRFIQEMVSNIKTYLVIIERKLPYDEEFLSRIEDWLFDNSVILNIIILSEDLPEECKDFIWKMVKRRLWKWYSDMEFETFCDTVMDHLSLDSLQTIREWSVNVELNTLLTDIIKRSQAPIERYSQQPRYNLEQVSQIARSIEENLAEKVTLASEVRSLISSSNLAEAMLGNLAQASDAKNTMTFNLTNPVEEIITMISGGDLKSKAKAIELLTNIEILVLACIVPHLSHQVRLFDTIAQLVGVETLDLVRALRFYLESVRDRVVISTIPQEYKKILDKLSDLIREYDSNPENPRLFGLVRALERNARGVRESEISDPDGRITALLLATNTLLSNTKLSSDIGLI